MCSALFRIQGFIMGKAKILVMLYSLLAGANTYGSFVMETWTGEVGAVSGTTAYVVGETVTWTISYETLVSDRMTIFSDGLNGVADRGTNDDTVSTVFCLDPTSDDECAAGLERSNGFFALYDSKGSFDNIYQRMVDALSASQTIYDYWDVNMDNRIFRDVPWGVLEQYDYRADEFWLTADNYPYRCGYDCPNTGNASIFLTYLDAQSELQFANVSLTRVSYTSTVVSVPVPGTLCLMVVGGLGLLIMGYRTILSAI